MQRIFSNPKVTYVVLVVAIVAFFGLSAVGNTGTDEQNKHSSVGWIGSIGWGAFLITVLLTIVFSGALLVRTLRRRRNVAA